MKFYFLFFIKIIISNYKIEKVFEWTSNSTEKFNNSTKKNSNSSENLNYFPSHIGIDKNNKIYVSFPIDYYGQNLTPPFKFAYLEKNQFKQFFDFEDDNNCTNENKLCNCISFEIDENDNFYILDQINNSYAKIIIYNKKSNKKHFINLPIENETDNFYLNFVVDTKNEIIYLIHSFYTYHHLNLYVIENIHDEFKYKINLIRDNYFRTQLKSMDNYFEIKNLGLSCDYKYLFISSLNFNFVYSIKIEDIFKCIEKKESINKEIVEENNIQEPTNSFILSSKGNLYIGGKNSYEIFISYNMKNKVNEMNSKNVEKIYVENNKIQFKNENNNYKILNSLFIHKKYLYFLENNFDYFITQTKNKSENLNNEISYYGIYKIDLKKDDSIYEGCQYLKFKNDKNVIIFWIISFIFIIFIMIILFIGSRKKNEIANSYLKLSNSEKVSMININNSSKRTTN